MGFINKYSKKIKEFVGDYVSRRAIKKYIEYGCAIWIEIDDEIKAYIQFVIKEKRAHITYLKIQKGMDSYSVMQYFIAEGKRRFPFVDEIEWEREIIGDNKKRVMKI